MKTMQVRTCLVRLTEKSSAAAASFGGEVPGSEAIKLCSIPLRERGPTTSISLKQRKASSMHQPDTRHKALLMSDNGNYRSAGYV